MGFDLDPSYKQVPERIADFKAKHPEGCLQPADPEKPYRIETIGDKTYIVFVAAAYRSPDDPCPGIGTAWEPFPGRTPFTKDSELQNAETSAWGRAIVAVLASESKAVANAEDVRNRQADHATIDPALVADLTDAACSAATDEALRDVWKRAAAAEALNVPTRWPDTGERIPLGELIAACKERLSAPPQEAA